MMNSRKSKRPAAASDAKPQPVVWAAIGVISVALVFAYSDSFESMLDIWLSSDTFAHGFVIFPISMYLIWRQRDALAVVRKETFMPGAFILLALACGWTVAYLLGIQFGEHLAVVAMIPASVLVVAGKEVLRQIRFPLAYLLFAVPFGEALIPYLIEFTSIFAEKALQLTGIPVLREGIYFAIPAGNFEVAKACSGVRYLLATMALGTLFAYLNYSDFRKRLLFFMFSIILPIVANGIRAYLIVVLAHYSDMRIAVGVDHIIYGWIFFGIVVVVMFLIGARFRDADSIIATVESKSVLQDASNSSSAGRLGTATLVALMCILTGPVLAVSVEKGSDNQLMPRPGLPSKVADWSIAVVADDLWRPAYSGWTWKLSAGYESEGVFVRADVLQYLSAKQGGEVVSATNTVADEAFGWIIRDTRLVDIRTVGNGLVRVQESLVMLAAERRLIWHWVSVGDRQTHGILRTKLLQALDLIAGKSLRSSAVFLSIRAFDDIQTARSDLERFLIDGYGDISICLNVVTGQEYCSGGEIVFGAK